MTGAESAERKRLLGELARTIREGALKPRREELFEELWAKRRHSFSKGTGDDVITLPRAARVEFAVGKNSFYVSLLGVQSHLRSGLGVGARLLSEIEDLARGRGKHYVALTAVPIREGEFQSTVHPYEFYRKLGYVLHPSEDARWTDLRVRARRSVTLVKYLTPYAKSVLKNELKRRPRGRIRLRIR